MFRITLSLIVGVLIALGLCAAPAHAQFARTFVSSVGNDANDCNRLTPCRTFQRAHDNTLANGEVTVLDPGGYGAVTISKTISIINDGVGEAGALVSGGANGITVAAGAADAVSLRGLTIKGIGFGGGNGIVFNSGKSLTVENCAIRNLSVGSAPSAGVGILFQPSTSSTLAVSNTFVADNIGGVAVQPTAAANANATLSRTEMHNNSLVGFGVTGFNTTGTVAATVADSVAARNGNGFLAVSGGTTGLMVVRSVAANNDFGLQALGASATLRVGDSIVTGNTTGWVVAQGGTVQSYGNNAVNGNAGGEGAMPLVGLK